MSKEHLLLNHLCDQWVSGEKNMGNCVVVG